MYPLHSISSRLNHVVFRLGVLSGDYHGGDHHGGDLSFNLRFTLRFNLRFNHNLGRLRGATEQRCGIAFMLPIIVLRAFLCSNRAWGDWRHLFPSGLAELIWVS